MRCLRRCGRAVVNAASAAVFSAVTWCRCGSVAPVPSATRWCTATVTPRSVTNASTGEPSRWVTVTGPPASSGGTEYRFPRKDTSACAVTVRGTPTSAGTRPPAAGASRSCGGEISDGATVPVDIDAVPGVADGGAELVEPGLGLRRR